MIKELKERENTESKAINTEEHALDKKGDHNKNIEFYAYQGTSNNPPAEENHVELDKPQNDVNVNEREKNCNFN
jgi:hypothetical protein